ncbi:MAG: hypothetical protein F4190_05920 [Acidimicrobiales bacterium]|nr:hypothetical protein [Acidimicrobiaceae bacterium]MYG88048.1 hypothetical protein [Acidimicrobiales bacterium]MYI27327.1 hypothetical protein [Acidimicrobiales bacterium]MYJ85904.1 hypothetical protein [Acidimicrobiaceae bacterium]
MSAARKWIAQACVAAAGAAMFLPWHINAGLGGNQTVRGISTGIGRLLLVICMVTVVLVQLRWRPAWIGAGFAGAMAVRELFSPSGVGAPDAGLGPQIAFIACAVAVILLGWNMFAGVAAGEGRGPDEPPRWFFSGPLGRRR